MIKLNAISLPAVCFKHQTKEILITGISFTCMILFASTAYFKIIDHEGFLKGLSKITYIGHYASYISWMVSLSELLVAALLISPRTQKWGLYGFTGMMLAFTIYVMGMLFWAAELPCHCAGAIESLSWVQHIWFNLGFITLASFALWLGHNLNNKQNENKF